METGITFNARAVPRAAVTQPKSPPFRKQQEL